MEFESQTEAAAFGLFLAITAPTDAQSQQALMVAQQICEKLTQSQFEEAKEQALQMAEIA